MTKFLLVVVVIAVALAWLAAARRRDVGARGGQSGKPSRTEPPAAMLACVHCGLHLPQPEALFDAAGRPYCSEAHRLAGPR